jgi:hypothetical protein
MQELWGHGSFLPDFKGRPGRPGMCSRFRITTAAPERVLLKAVRMKPKLQWRLQNFEDARNMEYCQGKPQAMSGSSSRLRPSGLQMARIGLPSLLEFTL